MDQAREPGAYQIANRQGKMFRRRLQASQQIDQLLLNGLTAQFPPAEFKGSRCENPITRPPIRAPYLSRNFRKLRAPYAPFLKLKNPQYSRHVE
jgi:hypothetical protein